MAAGLGDLVARLLLDAAPFQREMQQQQGLIKRFTGGLTSGIGSAVRGFGQLGLAVQGVNTLIAGMDRLVGTPLRLAAAAEQTTIAFKTMIGDVDRANALLGSLREFTATTPFREEEVFGAGRQLLAFGFDADEIAQELRMLGDIAAGVGAPLGELAFLHGTLNVQGRAYAVDLRQLAQRGIPVYEALADVLGVNTAEVKKMTEAGKIGFGEVQEALQSITKEGGRFAGLTEQLAGSAAGAWSTLQDNIAAVQREIGTAILEELDLTAMIQDMSELAQVVKRDLVPAMTQLIELTAKFGKEAITNFAMAQKGLQAVLTAWMENDVGLFTMMSFDEHDRMLRESISRNAEADAIAAGPEAQLREYERKLNEEVDWDKLVFEFELTPKIDDEALKEELKLAEKDQEFALKLTQEARPELVLREDLDRLERIQAAGLIEPDALAVGLEHARDRFASALELTPSEEAKRFLAELQGSVGESLVDPETRKLLDSAAFSGRHFGRSDEGMIQEFMSSLEHARPDIAGRADVQGLAESSTSFDAFRAAFEGLGMEAQQAMLAAAAGLPKLGAEKETGELRSLERDSREAFEVLANAFRQDPLVNLQQQANEHLAAIAANTADQEKLANLNAEDRDPFKDGGTSPDKMIGEKMERLLERANELLASVERNTKPEMGMSDEVEVRISSDLA